MVERYMYIIFIGIKVEIYKYNTFEGTMVKLDWYNTGIMVEMYDIFNIISEDIMVEQ